MISKTVIDDYLKKELNDWSWIKDVSEEDLYNELKDFTFKMKPRKHQLAAILIGITEPQFLFWLDMGLGKTFLILAIITHRKRLNQIKKTLVLVPNVVSIGNWGDEIEKHSDLTYTGLFGLKEERSILLKNETDLDIINYMGLQALVCENIGGKMMIILEKLEQFAQRYDCLIGDESQNYKNIQSVTYKICNELSKRIYYRYGLTGTPFGRDAQDLWSQFFIADRGETLGQNITFYRQAFFTCKQNHWKGFDYKLIKELEPILHKKLQNKSIRYSEKEVDELPPKIYIPLYIDFTEHNLAYYKKTVLEAISAKGNIQELEGCFTRLRQISSGFIQWREDGEREVLFLDENPKLDTLINLIQSTREESKIVVFNEFIISGDLICEKLKDLKIKYSRLYGGTKDKIGAKDEFVKNKNCKVFVVNLQSGSTALNLQVANYIIFHESPVSPIVRQQAEKRCHRIGQKDKVFIYDLMMKGSIDIKISQYLKQGKDLFQSLIEGSENFD